MNVWEEMSKCMSLSGEIRTVVTQGLESERCYEREFFFRHGRKINLLEKWGLLVMLW